MMSINHQLPGPPIDVCEGDRVIIDVKNCMDGAGLTLHWHGIFQKWHSIYGRCSNVHTMSDHTEQHISI